MIRKLRTPVLFGLIALSAAIAGACTEPNPDFAPPEQCADSESLYLQSFPAIHPNRLDVIFVVDSTSRSRPLRGALRSAASGIIETLDGISYRIGVVTTDSGGVLRDVDSEPCPKQGFVSPDLEDPASALGCLLDVPDGPDVAPATLEAAVFATDARVNPGFIRVDARLLIVAISMWDDCSSMGRVTWPAENCEWERERLTPVGEIFGALRRLKADQNSVAFAAIVGPNDRITFPPGTEPDTACSGSYGAASHGLRYHELSDLLAPWSYTDSVCTADISAPIQSALTRLSTSIESHYCLGRDASGGARSVEIVAPNATDGLPVDADNGAGWAFVGPTPACSNGVLALGLEARQGLATGTMVDVLFCGP